MIYKQGWGIHPQGDTSPIPPVSRRGERSEPIGVI